MNKYRLIQFRRYHDSFVSEFFWQLENVVAVLRGRAQHQQRFKEVTLSTVFSVLQNAGTIGSTVSAAGGVVLNFFGQFQEKRRVETLNPEYLSGQWDELKKFVDVAAEMAVERYHFFLAECSEADAVELGRVSVQRLWEYIPREKLSLTVDHMLMGILKGKSGRWMDDWRNTEITESAKDKRQTAEGALKHAGVAYVDANHQWHYAVHPRDKEAEFPKYGFMVLPEILAKTRIEEKKYLAFTPSSEQVQRLEAIWLLPISEAMTEDRPTVFASLTPEVAERLCQLETDWLTFNDWRDTVEQQLNGLALQGETHRVEISETKKRVAVLEDGTVTIQTDLLLVKQKVAQLGDKQEDDRERIDKTDRKVSGLLEQRRFTYIPKPYFQPRISLWEQLERRFSESATSPLIAIVGSGGMGKTSLIAQWAQQQKFLGKYHTIRRMVMDDMTLESSLVDLARDLYVTVEKRKREDWLAEVAQRLKLQSWLMIWDNVENYETIKALLPFFTLKENPELIQHLVVTSRETTCWEKPIFVDTFSPKESLAYIQHQMTAAGSPWFNQQQAETLTQCFDHHPLALELAMGHVCLYERRLDDYLKELETAGITTLNASKRGLVAHERINPNNLATLWKMGLGNLTSDAIALLRLMSFIDVEGVGRDLITHYFDGDQDRCNEALLALRQQAFIKSVTNSANNPLEIWRAHRLLQAVVREEKIKKLARNDVEWLDFLNKGWSVINAVFPNEIKITTDKMAIARCVVHGHAFFNHIQIISKTWSPDFKKTVLLLWQATLLLKVGNGEIDLTYYNNAKESLSMALVISRTVYGETENHPDIATTLCSLGRVYICQNDYSNAKASFEASLTMTRAIHGEMTNRSDIAITLSCLGDVYIAQGEYSRGIHLYEASLVMARAIYGATANSPIIATTLNSLGLVYHFYHSQKNYSHAIELYRAALNIMYAIHGETAAHSGVAAILNNLGEAYRTIGDLSNAMSSYKASLTMMRNIYGEESKHPGIATTLDNLGKAYCYQGYYQSAISSHNASLTMARSIYGKMANHPIIAVSMGNLGLVYCAQGNYTQAISSYEACLIMCRAIYGKTVNHPEIATALYGLAHVYQCQGNYSGAAELHNTALTMYRAIYGETTNHPDIAVALAGLGNDYYFQNNYSSAIASYEASLMMYYAVFGETTNHPKVATIVISLSTARQAQDMALLSSNPCITCCTSICCCPCAIVGMALQCCGFFKAPSSNLNRLSEIPGAEYMDREVCERSLINPLIEVSTSASYFNGSVI